jgi:hypothetical protein
MNVFKHRWLTALALLAVTVAVIGLFIGATGGQPPNPTSWSMDDPTQPAPEMTEEELGQLVDAARSTWASHVPVVAGTPLELPEDAILDTLIAKGHQNVEPPAGSDLRPLELPIYLVVRDGEMASVSKATGEFQIGADHQETFQFLIDQLGRENMQLVPTDFYEKRWGPFRGDNRWEDGPL